MRQLYGRGSVEEIAKGKKYRIQQPCGKDPVTGKYVRIRETFCGTRRQAEMRLEQIRAELARGRAVDAGKVTFADWLEQYLSSRESMGKQRPSTLKRDRSLSKHLLRGLGGAMVVDITPAMVNGLYASLRDAGVGDTTVRQCHRLLKAVMKQAVNNDLILRNPVDRAESPKAPKPARQSLGIDEANRLAALCSSGKPTANRTAVYLALATGARLGEILGLTWEHVALEVDRPYIHYVQQFTPAGQVAPLKTDKDENPVGRIVPLDASTVAVLSAWNAEQRGQLGRLGIGQDEGTPIITNAVGGFVNHHNFEHWFQSFCVENGFGRWVADDGREIVTLEYGQDAEEYPEGGYVVGWRDSDGWPCDASGKRFSRSYKRPCVKRHYRGLHFHELRHTHFTMRLASGTDIPTAQYLGGWSSPAMLMNVYAHPVAENIWDSAGFMDRLAEKDARR